MSYCVAIEGGDACGKATQARLLADRLHGEVIAFPSYDTATGRAILGHLKREWMAADPHVNETDSLGSYYVRRASCDALVFQALMVANRLEVLPKITTLLEGARPIVFDRYHTSGQVYGALDGLDPALLCLISGEGVMPDPEAWILLDVPVDEAWARRPERRDRYEADRGYMERVRAAYLRFFADRQEAERRLGVRMSWHVVDGRGTVEEVHARIAAVTPGLR